MNNAKHIRRVCIYCASSSQVDRSYFNVARDLGRLLAENGIECICGAGNQGLMAELSESVLEAGGKMIGIIPRFMYNEGWFHSSLTELIVTDDIHERKSKMATLSDAVIALPGGCGTMEELLEIITWKQLGLYFGPILIVNVGGYYNSLLEMLNRSVRENFMRPEHLSMWSVVDTPTAVMEVLFSFQTWRKDARQIAVM